MRKKDETNELYKKKVAKKLQSLEKVFLSAAVGDFNINFKIPEEDDEFKGLFVGIKLMTDVINEKTAELNEANKSLERIVRERTNALIEAQAIAGLGSWEMDTKTKKIKWSAELYHIFEKENHFEPNLQSSLDRIHPSDKLMVENAIYKTIKTKKPFEIDYRILMPKSGIKIIKGKGKAIVKNGEVVRLIGTAQDITQQKLAEDVLIQMQQKLEERVEERTQELSAANETLKREIEEKNRAETELATLAAIVKYSDDSIVSLDLDGTIVSWNTGAERMYGYTAKEALGQKLSFVSTEERKGELDKITSEIRKGNTIEHYETERLTKEGSIIYASVSYSPIKDKQGTVIGISGIARNITHRKLAERERERLISKLEATNRELESFAYITSHDLKAPLRAIGSLSDWIYTDYLDKLDEQGQENLRLLKGRVSRMDELINGILKFSRIGRVDGERRLLDLNHELAAVVEMLGIPASTKLVVENELPVIFFYKAHITQVFENLLSNAIKYADKKKGEIIVGVRELPRYWKFYVKDNGDGIEEKYHTKIFEIFQTLKRRDEAESTGIGLTIVKKIVENAGGQVWVDSIKGQGSCFYFTLPKIT